ncbi:MAG: tRNA (mnm(5)s(2)U34)-methyltransferase [Breznakia sp.]
MYKITQEALAILCAVDKRKLAIDFTCGRGFDTFHLAHHFQVVHAFDVQAIAIEKTKEKCRFLKNVTYHLCSHEHFDVYVEEFDVGIFNLGYLPHSDKTITTNAKTVNKTLAKALLHLRAYGRIVIVVYPGFAQGYQEACAVEAFCEQLPNYDYDVSKICLLNRKNAPYIIRIDKCRHV